MKTFEITLPYPPTVNTYWRHVGRKVLISAKGRSYRKAVADACFLARAPKFEGRLCVDLCVHPPDRRARDLDNLCKSSLDSMVYGGLFDDDEQIDYLFVRRECVVPGGKLVVVVSEHTPAASP